jgi:hypothetical protein
LTLVKKPSKLLPVRESKKNGVKIKMNWDIEYKKENGFAKESEVYENVEVIGGYGGGAGFMGIVPSRITKYDKGIRKFCYYGIINQTLAN